MPARGTGVGIPLAIFGTMAMVVYFIVQGFADARESGNKGDIIVGFIIAILIGSFMSSIIISVLLSEE